MSNGLLAPSGVQVDYWPDVQPRKGFFDLFRVGQYPTQYPAHPTAVTADVLESGLILAGVILAVCFLLILPGIRNWISAIVKIFLGVFILTSIMICNFGQEWEVSHITTKTQYRAGIRQEINASIGVSIGLRSVNITLKGMPEVQSFENGLVNETINYNERFSWDNRGWLVGRGGFGPYAGRFNQEFREHQRKGSPYPILWIAEYFTLDGEGVRWGRHYLQAGYYAHICIWTALPVWLLSMILFKMVILYGALFSLLTGSCLLAANIIWASVRNANELEIPFEDAHLVFKWGSVFWLSIFTGLLCWVLGIVVLVIYHINYEAISDFFGNDVTSDAAYIDGTEDFVEYADAQSMGKDSSVDPPNVKMEMGLVGEDIEMQSPGSRYNTQRSQGSDIQRGYRRRTLFPSKKSQKRNPRPVPNEPAM